MYFSIGPKERLEDFFNYKMEYNQLTSALKRGEKLVAILGVRRVGKTSLMNILFNELDGINIWADGRIVEKSKDLLAILENGVKNKGGIFGSIKSIGLSVVGLEVVAEKTSPSDDIIRNAGEINLFIDEAQYAESIEMAKAIAYIYDRFPNVRMIVSGSEIRLIKEILGLGDNTHPLYGRRIEIVELKRLVYEKSLEFLKMGFKQLNKHVSEDELQEVMMHLDGLIGWLTLYGYEKGIANTPDALKKVENIAVGIAGAELNKFLENKRNKQLYIAILKYASGREWKELLSIVRDELGKVNSVSFTRALKELVNYSFLEKNGNEYSVADPLIKSAAMRWHS